MTAVTEELWDVYESTGDPVARAELLDRYLGLVHHVARQIAERVPDEVELDDLVSAGALGLVMALQSFDRSRGLVFSTYAMPRIRGAILDDLRARDWVPRSVRAKARRITQATNDLQGVLGRPPRDDEIAEAMELDHGTFRRWREEVDGAVLMPLDASIVPGEGESSTLEETLPDASARNQEKEVTHGEDLTRLRQAISELPQKERTILSLYYYEEMNLRQIAEVLHLTESRISQIRSKALKRLRSVLEPAQLAG